MEDGRKYGWALHRQLILLPKNAFISVPGGRQKVSVGHPIPGEICKIWFQAAIFISFFGVTSASHKSMWAGAKMSQESLFFCPLKISRHPASLMPQFQVSLNVQRGSLSFVMPNQSIGRRSRFRGKNSGAGGPHEMDPGRRYRDGPRSVNNRSDRRQASYSKEAADGHRKPPLYASLLNCSFCDHE